MTCLRNVVLLALGLAASACSGAVVQKEDRFCCKPQDGARWGRMSPGDAMGSE